MDPISLILGALLADATTGSAEAVNSAILDACIGFRDALKRRLADREGAQAVVEEYTANPDAWRAALEEFLVQAGAQHDRSLLDAASAVLSTADPAGASRGNYVVQVVGARSVQVGDYNIQTNYYDPR